MTKRKLSRVHFRIDAHVAQKERKFTGEVENLSLNGMFIETAEKMFVGDEVAVLLSLSSVNDDMAVSLRAEVVRTEERGFAVKFRDIPLDSYSILKDIVIFNTGDPDAVEEEYRTYLIEKARKAGSALKQSSKQAKL